MHTQFRRLAYLKGKIDTHANSTYGLGPNWFAFQRIPRPPIESISSFSSLLRLNRFDRSTQRRRCWCWIATETQASKTRNPLEIVEATATICVVQPKREEARGRRATVSMCLCLLSGDADDNDDDDDGKRRKRGYKEGRLPKGGKREERRQHTQLMLLSHTVLAFPALTVTTSADGSCFVCL